MSDRSWQEALDRLKMGNQRFFADTQQGLLRDLQRRGELTGGQQPFAIVLTCADSRVVPELAFDTGLGELFVIRVAGNVANGSSIASAEYAVEALGVRLIVVLAHESCGAVAAAVQEAGMSEHMKGLLDHIRPAVEASVDTSVDAVARLNSRHTAEALTAQSEIIRRAVDQDGLRIVTAFYTLAAGLVEFDE